MSSLRGRVFVTVVHQPPRSGTSQHAGGGGGKKVCGLLNSPPTLTTAAHQSPFSCQLQDAIGRSGAVMSPSRLDHSAGLIHHIRRVHKRLLRPSKHTCTCTHRAVSTRGVHKERRGDGPGHQPASILEMSIKLELKDNEDIKIPDLIPGHPSKRRS